MTVKSCSPLLVTSPTKPLKNMYLLLIMHSQCFIVKDGKYGMISKIVHFEE